MPIKVLVVDDEADLEVLITQKFRKQVRSGELQFLFARDGVEALAQLEAMPDIYVVLSDINMPRMDGLALLSELTEQYPLVRMIIITAYGDMRNIPSLTDMFEEKGLNVLYVEDGKEALKQLDIHPDIDLVLMDMMMPGMDGCKVTGEIRKQSRFKRLPVIALTERAIKEERQKCSEVGINDYLSKPIDTDKLLSVLRVWLY